MKRLAATVLLLFLSGSPVHALTWEKYVNSSNQSKVKQVLDDCVNTGRVKSPSGVRKCTSAISYLSREIKRTNDILTDLGKAGAKDRHGLTPSGVREARSIAEGIQESHYIFLMFAFLKRGQSYAMIDRQRANADCDKADEIRRFLRDRPETTIGLVSSCREFAGW